MQLCIVHGQKSAPMIHMNNEPLVFKTSVKLLGCLISQNLAESEEIRAKKQQLASNVNSLTALFNHVDIVVKQKLYTAHCSVFYGCQSWDFTSKHINDMHTMWRKGIRHYFGLPYTTRSSLLPSLLNSMPFYISYIHVFIL